MTFESLVNAHETNYQHVIIEGSPYEAGRLQGEFLKQAGRFLRRMKAAVPQVADHLEAAATIYDQLGDQVTPLWPWPIDPDTGAIQALADARTRRTLPGHVRAARDVEAEAADHLERALVELG
jgi:hypothetical protein